MKRLLRSLGGILILCGLFVVLVLSMLPKPGPTSIELMNQAYDLDKRRADDQATATSRATSIDIWNLLPPVLLTLVILAVLTPFTINTIADAHERRRRYAPDENGFYELPKLTPQLLRDHGVAQLTALHYAGQNQATIARHTAPQVRMIEAPAQTPTPLLTTALEAAGLPTAPSMAALLAGGFMPTPQKMLLGYGAGGPLYGGIESLLSTAIAGRPGQGKSTALRFIYLQTVLAGGDVAIFDPHGSLVGDLGNSPARLIASDAQELDDAGDWLTVELETRLADYKQGKREFKPLLVLCDEWPVIALKSAGAVAAAGRLILEGRKTGAYALISGQGLPATQFGGSLVRDALSSRYVFKTVAAQARMAGLDNTSAKLCITLDIGRAVFAGPVDPQVVAIPQTTVLDLGELSRRTGAATPGEHSKPYSNTQNEFTPSTTANNENNDLLDSDETAVILRLKAMGMGKVKTIEALYGLKAGTYPAYQTVSALYDKVVNAV